MSASHDWFPPLAAVTEPLVDPPRLPSGDWRQDTAYPAPFGAASAAELARQVSIENGHNLYALALDPDERMFEALLQLSRWSTLRTYRIGVVEADDPIERGFLRRLRITWDRDAPAQAVGPDELLSAFRRAEHARIGDMERWLRARYGERPPEREVFWWIDYPAFDNGTMALGWALLLHGPELHAWSRVRHAHK